MCHECHSGLWCCAGIAMHQACIRLCPARAAAAVNITCAVRYSIALHLTGMHQTVLQATKSRWAPADILCKPSQCCQSAEYMFWRFQAAHCMRNMIQHSQLHIAASCPVRLSCNGLLQIWFLDSSSQLRRLQGTYENNASEASRSEAGSGAAQLSSFYSEILADMHTPSHKALMSRTLALPTMLHARMTSTCDSASSCAESLLAAAPGAAAQAAPPPASARSKCRGPSRRRRGDRARTAAQHRRLQRKRTPRCLFASPFSQALRRSSADSWLRRSRSTGTLSRLASLGSLRGLLVPCSGAPEGASSTLLVAALSTADPLNNQHGPTPLLHQGSGTASGSGYQRAHVDGRAIETAGPSNDAAAAQHSRAAERSAAGQDTIVAICACQRVSSADSCKQFLADHDTAQQGLAGNGSRLSSDAGEHSQCDAADGSSKVAALHDIYGYDMQHDIPAQRQEAARLGAAATAACIEPDSVCAAAPMRRRGTNTRFAKHASIPLRRPCRSTHSMGNAALHLRLEPRRVAGIASSALQSSELKHLTRAQSSQLSRTQQPARENLEHPHVCVSNGHTTIRFPSIRRIRALTPMSDQTGGFAGVTGTAVLVPSAHVGRL